MIYNMPDSAKKHHESTESEGWLTAKIFFFFFFFFFRRARSKLRDSFTMVFAQNSSILHWAVHQPITTLKSHEVVQTGHWRTMASLATTFSKIVRMRTNHLAMKQLLFKIVELKIRLCAWRQGESLASINMCWLGVWREPVSDSSANTAYI